MAQGGNGLKANADITVAMIHPPTWENDGEVFPVTDPIPVEEWLEKVSGPGWDLEALPDDGLIAGGHVIMVHNEEEDNTFLFAVPPEAIPLTQVLIPEDQYQALLSRTPRLSTLAGR